MKYEHGKRFESEIEQGTSVPDIGYPIPNESDNQYGLNKLSFKTEIIDEDI